MDRIIDTSDHFAHLVLISLCRDNGLFQQRAARLIQDLEARAAKDATVKRKAAADEPQICVECKAVFTESENVGEPCQFHEGQQIIYMEREREKERERERKRERGREREREGEKERERERKRERRSKGKRRVEKVSETEKKNKK